MLCWPCQVVETASQNRRQKVVNRVSGALRFCGGLDVCAKGAWHSNLTKIPLIYNVSYFHLGVVKLCLGGIIPPAKAPRGGGTAAISETEAGLCQCQHQRQTLWNQNVDLRERDSWPENLLVSPKFSWMYLKTFIHASQLQFHQTSIFSPKFFSFFSPKIRPRTGWSAGAFQSCVKRALKVSSRVDRALKVSKQRV